jgi:hypothetical protein
MSEHTQDEAIYGLLHTADGVVELDVKAYLNLLVFGAACHELEDRGIEEPANVLYEFKPFRHGLKLCVEVIQNDVDDMAETASCSFVVTSSSKSEVMLIPSDKFVNDAGVANEGYYDAGGEVMTGDELPLRIVANHRTAPWN